ncbi:MAG TPA: hypothetical protein VHJ83_11965 [Micromonosporaceae bacterium]|nr:hypothetical protein [Micromonosporaceae bacterium]
MTRRPERVEQRPRRADTDVLTPSIWSRLGLGAALLLTLSASGVVTWLGVAIFVSPAASDAVWTWIERSSWVAAFAGLYVAVRGPRARDRTGLPSPALDEVDSGSATGREPASLPGPQVVVRKLWTDVEELLARDNRRRIEDGEPVRTWKRVARAAGIPSRNVNRWLKRKGHLPDETQFLNLITSLSGDPEEWASRWRRADAARGGQAGPNTEQAGPGQEGSGSRVAPDRGAAVRDRRSLFSAAALAGLLVGMLVAATPSTPLAVREKLGDTPTPETWDGVVVGTFRTDPSGGNPVDVGVHSYRGPYKNSQDRTEIGSYFTGDPVEIVCRVEDGRLIRDGSNPNKSSRRWYMIEDNTFLPALFVKVSPGIPECVFTADRSPVR